MLVQALTTSILQFALCLEELKRFVVWIYHSLFLDIVLSPLSNCLYDGVQFLVICRTIVYCIIECLRVEGNGTPMLDEDSSHNIIRCISVYLQRVETNLEVQKLVQYKSFASLYQMLVVALWSKRIPALVYLSLVDRWAKLGEKILE